MGGGTSHSRDEGQDVGPSVDYLKEKPARLFRCEADSVHAKGGETEAVTRGCTIRLGS